MRKVGAQPRWANCRILMSCVGDVVCGEVGEFAAPGVTPTGRISEKWMSSCVEVTVAVISAIEDVY